MEKPTLLLGALLLGGALNWAPNNAWAGESGDAQTPSIQSIRDEIRQMKAEYEQRIDQLEQRLQAAERSNEQTRADMQSVANVPTVQSQTRSNAFNPDISLILQGTYANLDRNPDSNALAGLPTAEEFGPGFRGFSLAESELNLFATVDPYFYGGLTLAFTPESEVEIEEAYAQTTALPEGFTVKTGRFFSSIGYLNKIHQHAWDFFDAPLVYQALLGTEVTGNYSDDGVQISWIAPTDLFLQFGSELGRGRNFPGNDSNRNGLDAVTAFAKAGGDIGISQSWIAGLSFLHTSPEERPFNNPGFFGDAGAASTFTGDTNLFILDGVWKWAPNGNPTYRNAQVQTELFYRREQGQVLFDPDGIASNDDSQTERWGFYAQAVYQFIPRWRTGLRFDYLNDGDVDYHSNNANLARTGYSPRKTSVMVDFSPSEFSRLRLQYALDESIESENDNQVFLQYIYSLGSHGAHQF